MAKLTRNGSFSGSVFFLLLLLGGSCSHAEDSQTRPLTFGYFPIISTVALYKRFSPLRDYLSVHLERPVTLHTAKDFPTFVKRTDAREYDILVTAPHFAVRAADSGKYRIRATLVSDVQQLVIVRKNSKFKHVSELAGKRIATPPRRALMTMMGVEYLKKAGLTGEKTPQYQPFVSHNAANEALLAGQVDAAIASTNIVKKAIAHGAELRIISRGLKLPNMATLVATDMDAQIGDQIVNILVDMVNSAEGKQTLKKISFPGYRAVNASVYEAARPYLEQGIADIVDATN